MPDQPSEHSHVGRRGGPPNTGPAPELVESGFAWENADAPYLHDGLNLADIAHVLDLDRRGLLPGHARDGLLTVLLELTTVAAREFPYDPAYGEAYNSRERYFVERLGDDAGWLHAGRPRREAARVALRLQLRREVAGLVHDVTAFAAAACGLAGTHVDTLLADQTYLQQAQPSTFGHYVLSFAEPAIRDAQRLLTELAQVNSSPGGAGCVNGSRLLDDRSPLAESLGFGSVIEHTRDAMWRVDELIQVLALCSSIVSNQTKLAEDLEIWSSAEFDFVDLDDSFSRASVLMPNKRNPYSLSIIRGASGILIGRLSGFLAVTKSPSARSDNFIFAYGEVPRAVDLCRRVTRLSTGVLETLVVHPGQMEAALLRGYSQATDLAEQVTQACGVDYRTAYLVVGDVVREASAAGRPGWQITAGDVARAARERTGREWDLSRLDVPSLLDARSIIESRRAEGGASHAAVIAMTRSTRHRLDDLVRRATVQSAAFERSEQDLIATARSILTGART
jgi:argininosuccinate lyase